MRHFDLLVALVGLSSLTGVAQAAVVPLPVTGYNQDIVVEVGSPADASGVTTGTMDGPAGGETWYERGYNTSAPLSGLPAAGSTIVSAAAADHSYVFPSKYGPGNGQKGVTENAFVVGTFNRVADIDLSLPQAFSVLSLIGASGHGPVTVFYSIDHGLAPRESGSLVVGDWFDGTPAAYTANGRVSVGTGPDAFDNVGTGNPRLYTYDFALQNTVSPVYSIQLSVTSVAGPAAFFALSGTPTPEPTSLGAIALGAVGLLARRTRRAESLVRPEGTRVTTAKRRRVR